MANPVPYQQLFDIDGLNAAIRDCEGAADEFSAAVTEDFKRINTSVQAIKKSIEALNTAMGARTIKLVDESSQQAIVDYAKQVIDLTKQVRDQQSAITNLNEAISANKIAISDAKAAAEQYKTEQQSLKAQQEATKLSIVQQTLSLEQQKQALTDSKLAAQQAITAQQNSKSSISAANLANQQYITTIKQNQAAQSALTTQIVQNRLQISNLALANKQAAQAQTAATGSYREAQQRLKALGEQIKDLPGEFNQSTSAGRNLVAQYNTLNDALKKFDASMGNHQRNVGNYGSALGNLQNELVSYAANLFTLSAAMEVLNKTFDAALQTDATRTSLGYILGNSELADEKLRALKETSNRLGLEFTSTAKAYSLFTGAAKASNFSLTEADKIFNSVSRAVGVLHLPAEQASNAFYALQEMISKGTIQSKELQRQLGQAIPGAVNIMADALGVSVSQLREMEKSGELLTADVLPKFAAQLDKTFAPGVDKVDSLSASVNNLKNTFTEAVDEDSTIGLFFKNLITNINNVASSILKTVNSSSWQEFWLRFKPAFGQSDMQSNINSADILHDLQRSRDNSFAVSVEADNISTGKKIKDDDAIKRVTQLQVAIDEARKAYQGLVGAVDAGKVSESGDLTFTKLKQTYNALQSTLALYKTEYPAAFDTAKKKQADLTDAQLTSIEQIRKRISDLSKISGSAEKGNPVEERIEALKKRLHELQPDLKAAKDGFQVLEERIKKVMLVLQDSVIQDYDNNQGKETTNTKKLADAYEFLYEKLVKLQKLRDDAILNVKRDERIKQFGSVFPTQKSGVDALNTYLNAKNKDGSDPSQQDKENSFDTYFRPDTNNKNAISNDFQISQNNSDIATESENLDKIVTKYAEANTAILNSYKQRNITKEEYDDELITSELSQTNEEYYINANILNKQLENAKLAYAEDSKQYSSLLAKKAKLDEEYVKKNTALLSALLQNKKQQFEHSVDETMAPLNKNASVVGSQVNEGAGQLFGTLNNSLDTVTKSMGPGGEALTDSDKFKMAADVGIAATKTYTDYVIKASEQRQAALEKEMQYEIDGTGNNAVAKRAIEAAYTEEIREEKTKQAKLSKAAAAIEIILNTAIAVSKTLASSGFLGIPLIPIIVGLGAVELALVLAQPIPQFEKGRENGPATFAEVNEKGPELIGKGNSYRIANKGKRGYTYLRENEKVIPAYKTGEIFLNRQIEYAGQNAEAVGRSKMIYDMYVMNSSKSDINYDEIGNQMKKAVNELPYQVSNFDEKGVTSFIRTKNTKIMAVRSRNKM